MKIKDDVIELQIKIKEVITIFRKYDEVLNILDLNIKNVDEKLANHIQNVVANDIEQRDRISQLETSVVDIKTKMTEVGENNYVLLHAVDDLERTTKLICRHLQVQDNSLRCEYCRQEFDVQSQLKEHVKKIHLTTLD